MSSDNNNIEKLGTNNKVSEYDVHSSSVSVDKVEECKIEVVRGDGQGKSPSSLAEADRAQEEEEEPKSCFRDGNPKKIAKSVVNKSKRLGSGKVSTAPKNRFVDGKLKNVHRSSGGSGGSNRITTKKVLLLPISTSVSDCNRNRSREHLCHYKRSHHNKHSHAYHHTGNRVILIATPLSCCCCCQRKKR